MAWYEKSNHWRPPLHPAIETKVGDRLGTEHGLGAAILHDSLLGADRKVWPIFYEILEDAWSHFRTLYGGIP